MTQKMRNLIITCLLLLFQSCTSNSPKTTVVIGPSGKLVDVSGLSEGTLVADPYAPHLRFRVPPARGARDQDELDSLVYAENEVADRSAIQRKSMVWPTSAAEDETDLENDSQESRKSGGVFGRLSPGNPFGEYRSPFGKYNPNNPFSEVSSPFGKLNKRNPFSEVSIPFGKYNPNNPFSEVASPFGKLNPNNPFSDVSSPFGKYNPNNPFAEGVHPASPTHTP